MIINRLCKSFKEHKLPYAIVGGYAVGIYGYKRYTQDLDIVIKWNKKNLVLAEQCFIDNGLISRLPISANDVFEFRDEYINNRNLIAWNFYNPKALSEQVDLLINFDLARKKTETVVTPFTELKVLNLTDLIKMKKESGREKDLIDIKNLKELHK